MAREPSILGAMRTALLSLHGFTMNGAGLRQILSELEPRLAESVELFFPDAPHVTTEASVTALARRMGGPRSAPPNLEWWNSSDDGRAYQGWELSCQQLRREVERHPAAGLLGFSQGAAVAALLAALACRGEFPPLSFVVLVAGFAPRAADLQPLFARPLELPSLHIWGESDPFAKHGPGLAEKFQPFQRQIVTWSGGHRPPTRGAAADALVEFVRSYA